jgi:tetratricopeptide (TPR) repeat protein
MDWAYEQMGKQMDAVREYNEAARLVRNDVEKLIEISCTLGRLGMYEDALRALKKGLSINPKSAGVYYSLGWIYDKSGRDKESLEAYQQAVNLNPKDADNRYALGWTYEKLGRRQEALREFKEAVRLKPDHRNATDAVRRYSARSQPA